MIAQPPLFAGMPSHIGKVGQRMTLNLRLMHKYENETGYTRYKYIFIAPSGDSLIWKTDTDKELREGDEYGVTFKVKAHSHYHKRKQTVIERPVFRAAADGGGEGG